MNELELGGDDGQGNDELSDDLQQWAEANVQQYLTHSYWDGKPYTLNHVQESIEFDSSNANIVTITVASLEIVNDDASDFDICMMSIDDLEAAQDTVSTSSQSMVQTPQSLTWWQAAAHWPVWTRALWASLLISGCTWAALVFSQGGGSPTALNSANLESVVNRGSVNDNLDRLSPEKLAAKQGLPAGSSLMNIADIRVGMRVAARNPEVSEVQRMGYVDPDPATWRFLKLRLDRNVNNPDDAVEIEMIRPLQWLEENQAKVGSEIYLDLEELGAKGDAIVLQIGPCPEIAYGPGEVVISTFAHQPTEQILDVTIESKNGDKETIGVTANHPFWSVDQQAFVAVGKLSAGSQVQTVNGESIKIVSLLPRPGPAERVYNLEVNGEHVYYVGGSCVLVHNQYETFYRTMRREHYDELVKSRKVSPTGETMISPTEAFSRNYDGVLVKFKVKEGTAGQLREIGVRDKSLLTRSMYEELPEVSPGWGASNAYFKAEGKQVNIGLGQGEALDIFNRNIIGFEAL